MLAASVVPIRGPSDKKLANDRPYPSLTINKRLEWTQPARSMNGDPLSSD